MLPSIKFILRYNSALKPLIGIFYDGLQAYYRGAQACVFAFSTTDRDSLQAVGRWKRKVEDECGDIPMVLVQNKIDMIAQSEIPG